jgi:signal transduction histidine kinase
VSNWSLSGHFRKALEEALLSPLFTFLATFLIGLFLSLAWVRQDASRQFTAALQAVESVRGYQGLLLDEGGISALLVNVLERSGGYQLGSIELSKTQGQRLSRRFARTSKLNPLHVTLAGTTSSLEVRAEMTIAPRMLLTPLVLSVLLATLVGSLSLFRGEIQRRRTEWSTATKLGELARQVAHDIRSPLGALKVFSGTLEGLDVDQQELISAVVSRIQGIADDLLKRSGSGGERAPEVVDLKSLLEPLFEEKRAQFSDRRDISLALQMNETPGEILGSVRPAELLRIISNLMNNSVEAIDQGGNVTVTLEKSRDDGVIISIRDSGRGIPEARIPLLGTRGATYDKPGGNGLGLSHAKQEIESWGGRLKIVSTLGKGTCVSIELPAIA